MYFVCNVVVWWYPVWGSSYSRRVMCQSTQTRPNSELFLIFLLYLFAKTIGENLLINLWFSYFHDLCASVRAKNLLNEYYKTSPLLYCVWKSRTLQLFFFRRWLCTSTFSVNITYFTCGMIVWLRVNCVTGMVFHVTRAVLRKYHPSSRQVTARSLEPALSRPNPFCLAAQERVRQLCVYVRVENTKRDR